VGVENAALGTFLGLGGVSGGAFAVGSSAPTASSLGAPPEPRTSTRTPNPASNDGSASLLIYSSHSQPCARAHCDTGADRAAAGPRGPALGVRRRGHHPRWVRRGHPDVPTPVAGECVGGGAGRDAAHDRRVHPRLPRARLWQAPLRRGRALHRNTPQRYIYSTCRLPLSRRRGAAAGAAAAARTGAGLEPGFRPEPGVWAGRFDGGDMGLSLGEATLKTNIMLS